MLRLICCLLFLHVLSDLPGQVIPADKAVLHYTRVYLQEEPVAGADKYRLRYAHDTVPLKNDRFQDTSLTNYLPAFWIGDLSFGSYCRWQISALDSSGKEIRRSEPHQFRIQKIGYMNLSEMRMDIRRNNSAKHSGGLIAVDYSRSIFDRSGQPVWTIPVQDTLMDTRIQVRDLKMTRQNTFTFLTGRSPLEIDMEGNIQWTAPYPFYFKGDSITYHHEFQKTDRGTYLVLGFRRVYRKVVGDYSVEAFENESELKVINSALHKKTQVSVLLEFDAAGKLIWFWDSNDHLTDEDLNFKKNPRGVPNFASHANAFSENKAGTKVYVGFRDLNRIVKVDKKTKKVERSYGEKYPSGHGQVARHAFRRQHGAHVTTHNSILVFNNNSLLKDSALASVIELKDNHKAGDSLVIWKMVLDFDSIKGKSTSGGNVYELPNRNLLVCAGTFNRIFEVTRSKEIVWDAFLHSKGKDDISWQAAPQYRCSWIPEMPHYRLMIPAVTGKPLPDGKYAVRIRIANTGLLKDRYMVELRDGKNALIASARSGIIGQGKEENRTITVSAKALSDRLFVVVRSLNSVQRQSLSHEVTLGK